jgi:hypothetical protein
LEQEVLEHLIIVLARREQIQSSVLLHPLAVDLVGLIPLLVVLVDQVVAVQIMVQLMLVEPLHLRHKAMLVVQEPPPNMLVEAVAAQEPLVVLPMHPPIDLVVQVVLA